MMKKISSILKLGLVSAVVVGFSGCIGGGALSKNIRVAKTKYINTTSEQINAQSSLAQKISTYPKSKHGVKFKKMRDGFAINGDDVYLDSEGEIVNYGYNWKDGSFCYAIKLSENQFKIKFNRVGSSKESIDIANLTKKGSIFFVETKTGEKFRGQGLILTSQGFIVTRNNSAFIYTIGEKTKQFTAPSGWHIAYFQNGDVASTKFLLLEKNANYQKGNSLMEFLNATKELGAIFGLTKKQDYMLISMDNPTKHYLFNITLGDKEVEVLSQCKRQNRYINLCDQVDYKQSLYQQNGLRNFEHYYWSIAWFQGKNTAYSITKEYSDRKVLIRDLDTGKTVEAANRISGFNSFTPIQDSSGVVKMHVDSGLLEGVDIDDVEKFLAENPDISKKK